MEQNPLSDLIAPHGGLKTPANHTVESDRIPAFKKEVEGLAALSVTDADLSSVYRMGDGGLSPLAGPMVKAEFDQVLRDANITRNGKQYAWTIPISLPVGKDVAGSLKAGQRV